MAMSSFGDLLGNKAYSPKMAPRREFTRNFTKVTRKEFPLGVTYIRALSHPKLLPQGFHDYIMHYVEKEPHRQKSDHESQEQYDQWKEANTIRILCTRSYAPGQPCFICKLIEWLDGYDVLDPKVIGQGAFDALIRMSPANCRRVVIPMLIRGSVVKETETFQYKKGPRAGQMGSKEVQKIVSDTTKLTDVTLWLSPDSSFAGDTNFFNRLIVLSLSREEIARRSQMLAANQHNSEEAAQDYKYWMSITDNGTKLTNSRFHDPQYGNWILYDKQAKSQNLSITNPQPEALDYQDVIKFHNEEVYPDLTSWGTKDSEHKSKATMGWFQAISAFRNSWVGREIEQIQDYNLDLKPEDMIVDDEEPQYGQPTPPPSPIHYPSPALQLQYSQAPPPIPNEWVPHPQNPAYVYNVRTGEVQLAVPF